MHKNKDRNEININDIKPYKNTEDKEIDLSSITTLKSESRVMKLIREYSASVSSKQNNNEENIEPRINRSLNSLSNYLLKSSLIVLSIAMIMILILNTKHIVNFLSGLLHII